MYFTHTFKPYPVNNLGPHIFQDCPFVKHQDNTSLQVTWHGDMRSYSYQDAGMSCNRWYFTFNGAECKEPASIDALIISTQKDNNEHRPATCK